MWLVQTQSRFFKNSFAKTAETQPDKTAGAQRRRKHTGTKGTGGTPAKISSTWRRGRWWCHNCLHVDCYWGVKDQSHWCMNPKQKCPPVSLHSTNAASLKVGSRLTSAGQHRCGTAQVSKRENQIRYFGSGDNSNGAFPANIYVFIPSWDSYAREASVFSSELLFWLFLWVIINEWMLQVSEAFLGDPVWLAVAGSTHCQSEEPWFTLWQL